MNPSETSTRPPTGFCQNCGRPLYPETARAADGLTLCEPCLHERYPAAAGTPPAGAAAPPQYTSVPYTPVAAPPAAQGAGASPGLAGLLGLVPGVGAMYNGQFIKALVHVVVFVVLVGIAESYDYAGWLIAAWVFYQIFDAAQTAAARRDGTPLPDPFGILEWSRRVGPQAQAQPQTPTPFTAPFTAPAAPAAPTPGYPPYQPIAAAPVAPEPVAARRGEPTGAIVLIAVGALFLLSNFGILRAGLIARSWPLLLLALGVWLLIRRVQSLPAPPASAGPAAEARRSPFSIAPEPPPMPETGPAPQSPSKEDRP